VLIPASPQRPRVERDGAVHRKATRWANREGHREPRREAHSRSVVKEAQEPSGGMMVFQAVTPSGLDLPGIRGNVSRQIGDWIFTVPISDSSNNGTVRVGGVIYSEKSHAKVCHGSPVSGYGFGHGSVTVLVTIANVPPSPLIAHLNGLIAFIHSGSVAVSHSCSLSVSEVLGGSSDPRVGGSSPSGRTTLVR
jgi:hypothetical protein